MQELHSPRLVQTTRVRLSSRGIELLPPGERHLTPNEARRATLGRKIRLGATQIMDEYLYHAGSEAIDASEELAKRLASISEEITCSGNVFVLNDLFKTSDDVVEEAFARIKDKQVLMPYEGVAFYYKHEAGESHANTPPMSITCIQDDHGRPGLVFAHMYLKTEDPDRVAVMLHSFFNVDWDSEDGIMLEHGSLNTPTSTNVAQEALRALSVFLLLVADNRVRVDLHAPTEKEIRARERNNRPALHPYWSVATKQLPAEYQTIIRAEDLKPAHKGGTHASPIPHSRRGHNRRLPNGSVIWVRECLIRGFDKHINRKRDYYSLQSPQG